MNKIWIATSMIRDYADSKEPTLYPHLYTRFVRAGYESPAVKRLLNAIDKFGDVTPNEYWSANEEQIVAELFSAKDAYEAERRSAERAGQGDE